MNLKKIFLSVGQIENILNITVFTQRLDSVEDLYNACLDSN